MKEYSSRVVVRCVMCEHEVPGSDDKVEGAMEYDDVDSSSLQSSSFVVISSAGRHRVYVSMYGLELGSSEGPYRARRCRFAVSSRVRNEVYSWIAELMS
jgi:hypothetical protein